MAFPTIPTGGRILSVQTAAETGTTHTFPSLSSLTKNSGDVLIAIVFLYDGNTTDAEFGTWGGGFTEFEDEATTTTLSIGCAWKVSTGSETGTFTVTSSGSARAACWLLSIAGAHQTSAPEAGTYATGTNANANPGAVTASWGSDDNLFIALAAIGEDNTSGTFTNFTAAPTNYTTGFVAQAAADDVVGSIHSALGFRQLASATDDPGTFTNDTTNVRWAGTTIVVRPAPPAPTLTTIATTSTLPAAAVDVGVQATVIATTTTMPTVLIPVSAPTDVAGCIGWFDASDAGTITESGGAVSQWDDKSGAANHVVQASGALKPGYGTTTLNGLNVVTFDGGDHIGKATTPVLDASTIFIVCQITNFTAARNIMNNSGGSAYALSTAITSGLQRTSRGTPINGLSGPAAATPTILTWTHAAGGGASSANGWTDTTQSITNGNPGTGNSAGFRFGDASLLGFIAEAAIYDNVLSTGDRESVYAYLATKWIGGNQTVNAVTIPTTSTFPAPAVSVEAVPATIATTSTVPDVYVGFLPTDLTGLAAWWDTSDLSTITADGSSGVSQLDDKSPNAYHLIQTTGSNRPETGNRSQNGLNVLDYVSSDRLSKATTPTLDASTIFAVVKLDVLPGANSHVVASDTTTGYALRVTSTGVIGVNRGTGVSGTTSIGITDPAILSCTFAAGGGASSANAWVNDTQEITNANPGTQISTGLKLGANQVNGQFWDGWIGEVVIYDSVLTTTDRETVRDYLNAKWLIYSAGGATVNAVTIATTSTVPQVAVNVAATPATIVTTTTFPLATGGEVGGGGATVNAVTIVTTTTLPGVAVTAGSSAGTIVTTATLPSGTTAVQARPNTIATTSTLPQVAVGVQARPATISTVSTLPPVTVTAGTAAGTITTTTTLPSGVTSTQARPNTIATTSTLPGVSVTAGTAAGTIVTSVTVPGEAVSVQARPNTIVTTTTFPLATAGEVGGGGATVNATTIVTTSTLPGVAVTAGSAAGTIVTTATLPSGTTSVQARPNTIATSTTLPAATVGVQARPATFATSTTLPPVTVISGGGGAVIVTTSTLPGPAVSVQARPATFATTTTVPGVSVVAATAAGTISTSVGFPTDRVSVGAAPNTIATSTTFPLAVVTSPDVTVTPATIVTFTTFPLAVAVIVALASAGEVDVHHRAPSVRVHARTSTVSVSARRAH